MGKKPAGSEKRKSLKTKQFSKKNRRRGGRPLSRKPIYGLRRKKKNSQRGRQGERQELRWGQGGGMRHPMNVRGVGRKGVEGKELKLPTGIISNNKRGIFHQFADKPRGTGPGQPRRLDDLIDARQGWEKRVLKVLQGSREWASSRRGKKYTVI